MRVRWIVYRLRRGMQLDLRCRWCRLPALPGKTWCEYHQLLKDPCEKCDGPVLRRGGRGVQPRICDTCNPVRAARRGQHQAVDHGS